MTAGAGAMHDAVVMMRYASSLYREQQKRTRRVWHAQHGANGQPLYEDTHEGFHCYHVCGHCGYFTDTMKTCPSCSSDMVYDLREIAVAESLQDTEEQQRHEVPKIFRIGLPLIGVLGLLLTLAIEIVILAFLDWEAGWIVLVTTVLVGAVVICVSIWIAPRWTAWIYYKLRKEKSLRWRQPLPMPSKRVPEQRRIHGEARPAGDLLTSPFSKTPCIGYRAGILFDAKGDARPPRIVLDETEVTDYTVAGETVTGVRTALIGRYRPVEMDENHISDESLHRFLRMRGLYLSDGELEFYECLLLPGDECTTSFHPESSGVGPVVDLR